MIDSKENQVNINHVHFLQSNLPNLKENIYGLTNYIKHEIFARTLRDSDDMDINKLSYHMEDVEFISKVIQDLCCLAEKIHRLK